MSETVPVDVKLTLFVDGVSTRPMRFWAHESVPIIAEARDGPRGPLLDVDGVVVAFVRPDGGDVIAPVGFVRHLSLGRYLCRIKPAIGGRWQAVVRCDSPTAEAAVATFFVDDLPAGAPPPATFIATDLSGLFVWLTADGAAIAQ